MRPCEERRRRYVEYGYVDNVRGRQGPMGPTAASFLTATTTTTTHMPATMMPGKRLYFNVSYSQRRHGMSSINRKIQLHSF